MEIAALVAFIAPLLPVLMGAAQELAAESAVKAAGKRAWALASRMWQKLSPHVEQQPAALQAAARVAATPDDPRARGALELQLEDLLREDPALLEAITELWAEGRREGVIVVASGERSVAAGGKVEGSVIVTGDDNTIQPREP